MHTFIKKLEESRIGIVPWLASFFALVAIRMIFESFSSNGLALFSARELLVVPSLYYIGIVFATAILLHVLTKTEMSKLFNLVLFGFILIPVVPIIDFIISGGSGTFVQMYLFAPLPQLAKDYITFFGPNWTSGVTYGLRIVCILSMLGTAVYVYVKTKKIWKVIVGILGTYTIGFFFGSLPATSSILMNLPKNPWKVTQIEMFQKFLVAKNIFALEFTPASVRNLIDTQMALILVPIVSVLLLVVFYLWNKQKFLGLVKKIRFLRLLLHFIAVDTGVLFGLYIHKSHVDLSFFGILALITLILTATCVWVFSLTTNDRNDIAIDAISNKDRLLITKTFEPQEFTALALIFGILALLFSSALGYNFMLLVAGNFILAYLYSYHPFRLRRFPLVAPLMMSLGIAFLVLFGYLLLSPTGTFEAFPVPHLMLIVFVIALIINIKDIKDIDGDSKNGVYTIPTLFGDRRGKIIISLLFALSYLLFPIVLHMKSLIITSIVFAAFTALLINSKKVHEGYVFGVYYLFFVVLTFSFL